MSDTWLDIITDAMMEIGVFGPDDIIPATYINVAGRRLNRLLDRWQALRRYAFNQTFRSFTLTPNHAPTLIGPGLTAPNFDSAPYGRPVRIESAALILNTSNPPTYLPLNIRDDDWWANNRVRSLTSTVPTDLYYSPDFPNGTLNLWPNPTFAYGLSLETWVNVQAIDLDNDLTVVPGLPPSYNAGIVLSLAELLTIVFGKPMPPDLPNRAKEARAAMESNNLASPRMASADYGTGAGRGNGGGFNWASGLPL